MAGVRSTSQIAVEWGVSERGVRALAARGRLRDAQGELAATRVGRDWVILSTVVRPRGKPGPKKRARNVRSEPDLGESPEIPPISPSTLRN